MKDMLQDRIAGALYGVAIGDALGAPLEFMSSEEIAEEHGYVTEMIGGGWLDIAPGETTDDTEMTLAVAEGIMENPDDPIPAIGERFIAWANSGPKDIGTTCSLSTKRAAALRTATERLAKDDWFKAAQYSAEVSGGRSGGNGALMRTVYPGLYYRNRLMAVETAKAIAQMTHWDEASNEACALYSDVIHYLITEAANENATAEKIRVAIAKKLEPTRYNLDGIEKQGRAGELNPTGYVVDSLLCALYSFWYAGNTFEKTVANAANLGGDADTIAAVTGGLAGAFYGFEAIPERWVAALSKADRARIDAAVDTAVRSRL